MSPKSTRQLLLGLNKPNKKSSGKVVRFSDQTVDTDDLESGQLLQLQARIMDGG